MNLRLNLNSISTRLILFGMAILLAGALGRTVVLSDYLRNDIRDQTSAQLLTLANYVAKDVDRDILARREFLEHVAAKLPLNLLGNPKLLQAWLAERYDISPLFSKGVFVLGPSGLVLADYPVLPDRVGLSIADRDYFQRAVKGEFVIGCPVMGRVSKVPVLPMSIPLRDRSGKVVAVLAGVSALNSPDFINTLYSTRVGTMGGLVLVSPRDKLFVAASDADVALKPITKEWEYPQLDQALKGWRGVNIGVNSDGIEEFVAVASAPGSGWFVMARLPTSVAFSPITRLRRFIVGNLAILLPVSLLILALGLRYMLRPLRDAAEHADRMTQNIIPLEPLPVVRNDEVGHLTLAFNRVLSKLLESRTELEHLAQHDPLTGLPNRQLLADRMNQAKARAQRSQGKIALLYLDLDGFKQINDELGHEAGDAALREVAARLLEAVRREDTLARVGGDEFVILLSDLKENIKDVPELVAAKCLEIFKHPFIIQNRSCRLGTSIGIAAGDGDCPPDRLLTYADQAMYRAKESGRGRFMWADQCAISPSDNQQGSREKS